MALIPSNYRSPSVAIRFLAEKLLLIFKEHIGLERAISYPVLFKKIFGHQPLKNDLGDYLRWDFVRKAMSFLRKHSNCFIVWKNEGQGYIFFVPQDYSEAMIYVKKLNQNIRRIEEMKARALRSIEEGWYQKKWEIKKKIRRKKLLRKVGK